MRELRTANRSPRGTTIRQSVAAPLLMTIAMTGILSLPAQAGESASPGRAKASGASPVEAQAPGTARDYFAIATPLAEAWRADAELAFAFGSSESLWVEGKSPFWVFDFESPSVPESLLLVSVFNGFGIAQAAEDSLAVPVVDPNWIDSDQAMDVAEANGGADLRASHQVDGITAELFAEILLEANRSVWFVFYSLADTFLLEQSYFIDAVTGEFIGHAPVGIGGDPGRTVAPLPRAALGPNYPNPFNPSTTIPFVVPSDGGRSTEQVVLGIYDLRGRLVRVLLERALAPGRYSAAWDGRMEGGSRAPSGVYVARLSVSGRVLVRKMALVK